MDLSKLTMGEGSFGIAMPVLLLLLATAIVGGIIIALNCTRRTVWMIVMAAVILLISGYCLFLAANSVLHAKKTVFMYRVHRVC